MDKTSGKLTVFFEEPFWVGVFERVSGQNLNRRCSNSGRKWKLNTSRTAKIGGNPK